MSNETKGFCSCGAGCTCAPCLCRSAAAVETRAAGCECGTGCACAPCTCGR